MVVKLDSVHVKNFKTLEDLRVDFSGFYTAISGKNNAGKTNVISVLRQVFKDQLRELYFYTRDEDVRYQDAKTQWVKGSPDIEFHYEVSIFKDTDPGLHEFIEKITENKDLGASISLRLSFRINQKDDASRACWVNGSPASQYASEEIFQKLASSNLAFVHDSAARDAASFYGRTRSMHEIIFTQAEKKQLLEEQKKLQNKVKSISKAHKSELSDLLGHLEDKYEVEFSVPDMYPGTLPFSMNLKDKNVDVPLDDWGSGTKNRTHILMSILQAKRIQSREDPNRITPFVMIEEPESFLHPSGQAEFGRVLRKLANDLEIQIIVTTHSPYMLSQDDVRCNVLLDRKIVRNKIKQTEKIDLQDSNWMEPFSLILGLDNSDFESWKSVLSSNKKSVLLVEGDIDKSYLEHISSLNIPRFMLPRNVEVVPYGGKDALKNAILLKFIIQKFERVLVTFDLDAKGELERIMRQINLNENEHYIAIGLNKPGQECIEGLVPEAIRSLVFANNTDLVMQSMSQDSSQRKSAKNILKGRLLDEFKRASNIGADDLRGFVPIFRLIANKLALQQ
jgi:putative ATP-dependent endonuclease of the OLD family